MDSFHNSSKTKDSSGDKRHEGPWIPEEEILALRATYRRDGIVKLDAFKKFLPTQEQLDEMAADVIYREQDEDAISPHFLIQKTNEKIKVMKVDGSLEQRSRITRVENFVAASPAWTTLTTDILAQIVGYICHDEDPEAPNDYESAPYEPWCLYKEKLNVKPAGGSGYAPHLDSPSLRVPGLGYEFITVMLAIDDMHADNGCLSVVKGAWSERSALPCEETAAGDKETYGSSAGSGISSGLFNPDGNGRQGALRKDGERYQTLSWEDVLCAGGDAYIFSGWLPHRSSANVTQQARRAVFFTYNAPNEGDLRPYYYKIMNKFRNDYKKSLVHDDRM